MTLEKKLVYEQNYMSNNQLHSIQFGGITWKQFHQKILMPYGNYIFENKPHEFKKENNSSKIDDKYLVLKT